jgi:hypothetical protein
VKQRQSDAVIRLWAQLASEAPLVYVLITGADIGSAPTLLPGHPFILVPGSRWVVKPEATI